MEPALTSRNFYQICGPSTATADVTLINGAKWDGALTGGTSADNYLASRSFNVFDQGGATGSWKLRSNASGSTDQFVITSAGNTDILTLNRSAAGASFNTGVFTGSLIPNGTYNLGSVGAPWNIAFIGNQLAVNGSTVINSSNDGFLRNLSLSGITGSTQCLQADTLGVVSGTGAACGGGSSLPVVDTTAISKGSVDATKMVRVEVDGLTSGATRVLTVPDTDLVLAGRDISQTFSGTQTFSNTSIHSAGLQTGGDILTTSGTADIGSTGNPFDFSYFNRAYSKDFRACYPTNFGTCWTLYVPGGAGDYFDILDQGGLAFLRLDTAAGRYAELRGTLRPQANNAYDLGASGLAWRTLYLNTSLIHNGTTRLDSSGNFNGATFQVSGSTAIDGSRNFTGNSYSIGGTTAINNAAQFVGAGVAVAANGIGGGGFNVWNGGGYDFGVASKTYTMEAPGGGSTCTIVVKGGIVTGGTC